MSKDFVCFEDQICLVTGAGSEGGIGFATARILGELGAKVAITTDAPEPIYTSAPSPRPHHRPTTPAPIYSHRPARTY